MHASDHHVTSRKGHSVVVLSLKTAIRRVKAGKPPEDVLPSLERALRVSLDSTPLTEVLEAQMLALTTGLAKALEAPEAPEAPEQ